MMKKTLSLLIAASWILVAGALFSSCRQQPKQADEQTLAADVKQKDCVEVLYFHRKQRCATCNAIEAETKAAIAERFAAEREKGELLLRVIDISQKENEPLVEKYEITWSSLLIIRHSEGKEHVENLTEFAFSHARRTPDQFRARLTESISEQLRSFHQPIKSICEPSNTQHP